jgi:hypothetical protein
MQYMGIHDITPQDLIAADWLNEYEASINALWSQLRMLNACIQVLEKLLLYPPDHLYVNPPLFWRLVEESLFDICVLIIWRISVDGDKRVLTLPKLKVQIMCHVKPEHKNWLEDTLCNTVFEEEIKAFRNRIEDIRNKYIGHINRERHLSPDTVNQKDKYEVLDEIRKYSAILGDYFSFLCFGDDKGVFSWPWGPPNDPLGVEGVLLQVAQGSTRINAPENDPAHWVYIKRDLSQEEMVTLNHFRTRLHLPLIG